VKIKIPNVYLAIDTRLEREVAIVVLPDNLSSDPNALKRFQGEAKSTRRSFSSQYGFNL
jgi:serine/threonine protein kinase